MAATHAARLGQRRRGWPATFISRLRLGSILDRAFAVDRLLTVVGLAVLAVLAATLVGLVVDPRVITGAPAWLKPAKFALSFGIYSFTFLWLLGFVRGHPRLVRLAAVVTAVGVIGEMAIIGAQVLRGTTSHFNVGTPLDAFLWQQMRNLIVAVFLMNLLLAALLLRQRRAGQGADPAWAWSLRFGLLLSLVGMGVAVLMTVPIPAQQAAFTAGQSGGHSIGVADGGPGLPVVGWSTVGGDLRAAHFVGLHGLQVMPLVGWLLGRPRLRWLTPRHRLALVWTAGLAYLGLVALLTWQALRGQPIIAPDAPTLLALGALAGATLEAAGAIIGHARWAAWRTAQATTALAAIADLPT